MASTSRPPAINTSQTINPGVIIGSALFVVFIFALAGFFLFVEFRGLTSEHGIDQAQISREISRGNGFNTKFLRPFALYQARQNAEATGTTVNLKKFEDTYHAPLGPLVNAAPLAFFKSKLGLNEDDILYPGDRIIAGTSMAFLLMAVLVFYLLIARIFDRKIGVVVVTLLVLCDFLWKFTHTGLPTMLLLFLFGFALFFLYKAVENQELQQSVTGWAALSAAFFGLMALAHWITIWMFFGALIFAAVAFRPRGFTAAIMAVVFLIVIAPGLIRNQIVSGTIHGDAFYALYNGLGALGEGGAMRNFRPDKETLNLQGFGGRIAVTSVEQFKNLIAYFGGILAAPVFFMSLLHPFRRPEISRFRWAVLVMWIFALIGMSIFGLPDGTYDANQMHILFAPVMAGYGLALVAILWNRMGVAAPSIIVKDLPFVILVLISSISLAVNVPRALTRDNVFMDIPNYPYVPAAFRNLNDWTNDREVIVSDMPWGTAWYADRTSVWMTKDLDQFDAMAEFFDQKQMPIAGVYLTPESINRPLGTDIMFGHNADWAYWILQPMNYQLQSGRPGERRENSFRYGVFNPIGRDMIFWSNYNRRERGKPTEENSSASPNQPAANPDGILSKPETGGSIVPKKP